MGFYQAMQLSAANLKPLIKNAESKETKKIEKIPIDNDALDMLSQYD